MRSAFSMGGEMGGFCANGNPLVSLLAMGGVGSNAPRQMQLDADTVEEELEEELEAQRRAPPMAAGKLRAQQSEARRKRRQARQEMLQKQNEVSADALVHFVYLERSGTMEAVVRVLEKAADAWQALQVNADGSSKSLSAASLAAFSRAHPTVLLVDCVEFLSFLCLRHSVVFRKFARERRIVHLLARFLPEPQLTQEEIQREQQERALEQAKVEQMKAEVAAAAGEGVKTEPSHSMTDVQPAGAPAAAVAELSVPYLGSPSPQPLHPSAGVVRAAGSTGATRPAHANLPTQLLCACLRFGRISIEVDASYARSVQSSNLLLRLLELFLSNVRPNVLHSSILDLIVWIDSHAHSRAHLIPLCGQLLHGNLYTAQMRRQEQQRRSEKKKLKADKRETKDEVKLETVSTVKLEPMVDAAPAVADAAVSDPAASASDSAIGTDSNGVSAKSEDGAAAPTQTAPLASPSPSPSVSPFSPSDLPYLSPAYGIRRVQHLSVWPKKLRYVRIRSPESESSQRQPQQLAGRKRARDNEEALDDDGMLDQDETPDDPNVVKRLKLEHVPAADPYISPSSPDASSSPGSSSDLSSDSSSISNSDDEHAAFGRADSDSDQHDPFRFDLDDDDEDHYMPDTHRDRSVENRRRMHQQDQEEDFFASWNDDPDPDESVMGAREQEQKGGEAISRPVRLTQSQSPSLASYFASYDSDEEEAPAGASTTRHAASAHGSAATAPPSAAAVMAAAGLASRAESPAEAEARMAAFEEQQRRSREAAAAEAEQKESFATRLKKGISTAGAASPASGGLSPLLSSTTPPSSPLTSVTSASGVTFQFGRGPVAAAKSPFKFSLIAPKKVTAPPATQEVKAVPVSQTAVHDLGEAVEAKRKGVSKE
jgi:hypothetical protein